MMADNSQTAEAKGLPLSFWINVALSFVFVFIGVTFVSGLAFWEFARDWVGKESVATVGWVILAIGVVLGLFNAFRYYACTKAKMSKD